MAAVAVRVDPVDVYTLKALQTVAVVVVVAVVEVPLLVDTQMMD